jgi:small subunit ribosomal protein S6
MVPESGYRFSEKIVLKKERRPMPLYEHVFLSRQDVSAQQVEELTAQYKGIIEGLGGKITKSEYWGVKSLSFRMRKNRKAHFSLFNIDGPHAAIAEIERQEGINEDVLRFLTIRVEAHEEGPSAMMRKVDRDRERDDRDGGGGGRDFRRGGGGGFGGGGRGRDRDDRDDRDSRRPRDAADGNSDVAAPATEE